MSLPVWIGVVALGGVGAVARLGVDTIVSERFGTGFPYGILAVNLGGAFCAGLLFGAASSEDVFRLLGVGLLGGFTTFSTWMLQTHELGERGLSERALANVAVSLLAGLLAVWVGRELGVALFGG
jgi:CrcB protein